MVSTTIHQRRKLHHDQPHIECHDYQNLHSSLYNFKVPFPVKLHEMLENVEESGLESIVSWLPHGKAFRVHKPKEFTGNILPRFFKQSQYKSFLRQLHLYGFHRISTKSMRDYGAYYHESFTRDKKDLSWYMTRQKCKISDGRCKTLRRSDPNFYAEKDIVNERQLVVRSFAVVSSNSIGLAENAAIDANKEYGRGCSQREHKTEYSFFAGKRFYVVKETNHEDDKCTRLLPRGLFLL